jgi:hypothetical protein
MRSFPHSWSSGGSDGDVADAAIEGDSQSEVSRYVDWHITCNVSRVILDVCGTIDVQHSLTVSLNPSPSIEGDATSPIPQQPALVSSSSSSISNPRQSILTQTSPLYSLSPSRFRRPRTANAAAAVVTPSAFDKGGRARVHALARAAQAAGVVDKEPKTLRPEARAVGGKGSTPGKTKQQQQQQQKRGVQSMSPVRQQRNSGAVSQLKEKRQPQQKQAATLLPQQQQQQQVRGHRLHDQDEIVSPREESGCDDVSDFERDNARSDCYCCVSCVTSVDPIVDVRTLRCCCRL